MQIYPRVALAVSILLVGVGAEQYKPKDVPVEYSASVQAVGPMGAAATNVKIHIDRFTADRDRTTLMNALRTDGYQAFLPALRQAPVVGSIAVKDQKWDLRWAHQEMRDLGQVVTVATDSPVFFSGGGRVDAKPRAGYEVAVIRIEVDTIGMGKGTFAPAAHVKPNADATGVQIDDYGGQPLPITMVTRLLR
jgi:hypothetical protein